MKQLLWPALAPVAVAIAGCATQPAHVAGSYRELHAETVTQVSTINSLMAGNYDGIISFGELLQYGDFGLGTLHRLDGEIVILEGVPYQIPVSGTARVVKPGETTPFAAVTFFSTDVAFTADGGNLEALERVISAHIDPNAFHAIRIDGLFRTLTTRSVPAQAANRPLPEVIAEEQVTFELHNVKGTMVGLYCPEYVQGLNVPGYHFHFVTEDRTAGGHVLAAEIDSGVVSIDHTSNLYVMLPDSFDPGTGDGGEALRAVEQGRQ